MAYLYKFYEADDVAAASGTPLVAGSSTRDLTIPDGCTWRINRFGGSSSGDCCELELLYSDDGGSTWSNPFDSGVNKLSCIHLTANLHSEQVFSDGFEFIGSGTDVKLRLKVKNYSTSTVSEIVCFLEGFEK